MNPLAEDLDEILRLTGDLWEDLRGGRLFITGGTGFFGRWLLESLSWANEHHKLDVRAVVLSRQSSAFLAKVRQVRQSTGIDFITGDVRDFQFPSGEFTHVIHAATDASATLNEQHPLLMFDTIVNGTRRVLDFAVQAGVRKLLLTSSGAVYGPQPPSISHIPEDYPGGPDPCSARSAYGEGKRVSEQLCAIYSRQHGIETKIARCFAFVGPHLPLDGTYAIGNFIRDGLRGGPIQVGGDGTPHRSYMYASDLAVWLWTILIRGASGRPYNVGSEQSQSIAEVAKAVSGCFTPAPPIQIAKEPPPGVPPSRYVPSTARARAELGLIQSVNPCPGIIKTIVWNKGASLL